MALNTAHEGYEYQDLLTAFFILKEVLDEKECEFIIDKKEFARDRLDDLQVRNGVHLYKKQIKYSGEADHTFQKSDIASDSAYGIALDRLYESWLHQTGRSLTEFRLCLAWKEPTDELKDYLEPVRGRRSFEDFSTSVFKINAEAIWPASQNLPVQAWRRFRKAAENIDRKVFLEFCECFLIETTLPKFSLSLNSPGALEQLVIEQVKKLGIGVFPNDHIRPDHFILSIISLVKRARSKGIVLQTKAIFHELNIKTDYGTIEQNFPVLKAENIERQDAIADIVLQADRYGKIIMVGEPGSGKSWLIENLMEFLEQKGIKSIRHYCYTKLDDLLQKERIKLNVFYGNLISDILHAFPELKKFKQEKYASSLSELNLLLINIKQPTYIIVDGLDHIERIFNFRSYHDISKKEIAIIESLEKLVHSSQVKVIVTSQNVPELSRISSFHKLEIPAWNEEDIKALLRRIKIKNRFVSKKSLLSNELLVKSGGNPLYLKYLTDEIKKNTISLVTFLKQLPPYTFNLSEYYDYLISQLNTREDVPQVLSGVNFSLTKAELEEITGNGNHVADSLKILSPVLKVNFTQSGYIIYHESFRRYIIDKLKSASVSIERKVFQPVIEWFESKEFFVFPKAYRHFLPFLYESGEFSKMLRYVSHRFVTDSVINGQPWELIEKNYMYFVKAACLERNLPQIILLNEIDKVIATTSDSLSENFSLYFEVLGRIRGFDIVSEYLLFDGKPTLDAVNGLKACYICDENGIVAPWDQYMALLNERNFTDEDDSEYKENPITYFLRGMLILRQDQELNNTIEKAMNDHDHVFLEIARNEMHKYDNKEFVHSLIGKYSSVKKLMNPGKKARTFTKGQLMEMADKILQIDHSPTAEAILLNDFFSGFRQFSQDKRLLAALINKFKARNWFFNWIIYWLKVVSVSQIKNVSYYVVKEAFDYLKYSTDPFLGKPRVADLYSLNAMIYASLEEGLGLLQNENEWKEVIDLLIAVGNETTVSIQRSAWGPLETSTLFKLLGSFICEENRDYINTALEELTREKESYRLHGDIAEYNLRLALFFSLANSKEKAKEFFEKAVEAILAYPMHKDLTLYDAIEAIEWMAPIENSRSLQDIKLVKELVDAAVDHTDGKETNYFPILWYERFLKANTYQAQVYLLNELSQVRFNWIAERSLINLLCHANGDIDPILESYIAFTFPCNDSEKFVAYCLNLHERLKPNYPRDAEKMMTRILSSVRPRQHRRFSAELTRRINTIVKNYEQDFEISHDEYSGQSRKMKWYEESVLSRKEFSSMTLDELNRYFQENGIKVRDVTPLCYYFDQHTELTDSLKEVIQIVVTKNNRQYSDKVDIDIAFETGNDIECYYQVCRFFYDLGGWFERFENQQSFKKAMTINPEKAMEYLYELLPSGLDIGFNNVFSSNLIKALIDTGYDKRIIGSMWDNLLAMSSYRLPYKDPVDWELALKNDLGLNNEEILICILICRFKAATTERVRQVTVSLKFLLNHCPEKLVKPFKWFFARQEIFLKSAIVIVLQLLLEQKERGSSIHINLETEIRSIFPSKYFVIDFIISQLYGIPLPEIKMPQGILYPPPRPDERDFFLGLNRRFYPINDAIDLNPTFKKYLAGYHQKYRRLFELYQNRAYRQVAPHIYSSEYLLELANSDLYDEFRSWQAHEDKDTFRYASFIDIDAISAYGNSLTIRPRDLPKPYAFAEAYTRIDQIPDEEWVRLAHFEKSLKDEGGLRSKSVSSYGALFFSDTNEQVLPFSGFLTFPYQIWTSWMPYLNQKEVIVFAFLQHDPLEHYRLLWLNPWMVKSIGLVTNNDASGLVAVNESGEIVLKMRTWLADYLGDSMHTSLSDEIPRLEGTDLIIRRDYFQKIAIQFSLGPSYRVVKVEENSHDEA